MTRGLDLMRLIQKRATLFLCSAAVAAFATSAFARPVHHHHRHRHASAAVAQNPMPAQKDVAGSDMRYPAYAAQPAAGSGDVATGRSRRHGRQSLAEARAQSHSNSAYGGFSDNSLVAEARKYIGTNP